MMQEGGKRFMVAVFLACVVWGGVAQAWEYNETDDPEYINRRSIFEMISEEYKDKYPHIYKIKKLHDQYKHINTTYIVGLRLLVLDAMKSELRKTEHDILNQLFAQLLYAHQKNDWKQRTQVELRIYDFIDVYTSTLKGDAPFSEYREFLKKALAIDGDAALDEAAGYVSVDCKDALGCKDLPAEISGAVSRLLKSTEPFVRIDYNREVVKVKGFEAPPFCDYQKKSHLSFFEKKPEQGYTRTEAPEFSIYHPVCLERDFKYPLAVGLAPNASADWIINTWKNVAEEKKWIVYASKTFQNDVDMEEVLKPVAANIEAMIPVYSIDPDRIVATGISGGAMGSHALAYANPSLIPVE